ncbi:MAG TPA: IclR family transcriptional regulator [Acidimicrobiales bacterium]|jgi:DNA-binding IclR family transcriptional regulator|nr:IclR family transcriptional regulator [Acidimicrobiales bacterium]
MRANELKDIGATGEAKGLSGAERVLATLNVLGSYPEGIGLNELARALNSPRSSVHRALAILRRADLIEQDRDSRYRLGYGLLRLAFSYYEELDEVGRIRPMLSALAEHFGETSHYAILDGAEVVYLAKVQPAASRYQMTSVIGGRNPAYCTGVGKALLAYAVTDELAVREFVKTHEPPLVQHTDHTITTAEKLHQELTRIREIRYALDREENEPGINCLAIPLFLTSKLVPDGAISITAVAQRLPLARLEASVDEAREIVREFLGEVMS